MRFLIVTLLTNLLINAAFASIHCSIHGDTHVLMSDGSTKYQHHASGLFRVFSTAAGSKRMEVQCEFTQRIQTSAFAFMDPQLSGCRMKVVDAQLGCGVDVRHGGTSQPGVGSIGGQDMPLASMGQVSIEPLLGTKIIPLTNNALSVEVSWNGTFVQVVMGERSIQVHSEMIQQCAGLCGTCSGWQSISQDASAFISQNVVPANAAIQPDMLCRIGSNNQYPLSSLGSIPQLSLQSTVNQYPIPAYSPASMADSLYQAQFESQQVLMQVFSQCSGNNQVRLQVDPWFNSFVEDCMYDKSLGPGFEVSARSTMDAFITYTESVLRGARIALALRSSPTLSVCAACIPVQWTDPVNSAGVLTPSVTTRAGSLNFPLRYSGAASRFLMPNQLINVFAGPQFMSGQWNSPISLGSLSSLNLLPLPQQLLSSPIVVGENGQDVSSSGAGGLTWNPFPQQSSGLCGIIDQQLLSASDSLTSSFLQNGQTSQLAQLVRQGQYPYLACALSCASQLQYQGTSLSSLNSVFNPYETMSICPTSQAFGLNNMYNNMLYPYGQAGALGINGINSFSGLNGINGFTGLNGINGINGFTGLNGINGINSLNNPYGINGLNGLNGLNGINALSNVNGLSGINNINGINGINNINGINGINGINAINNGLNGLYPQYPLSYTGQQPFTGINYMGNVGTQQLNGINNVNSLALQQQTALAQSQQTALTQQRPNTVLSSFIF